MKTLTSLLLTGAFATALTTALPTQAASRALNATTPLAQPLNEPLAQKALQAQAPLTVSAPVFGFTASPRVQLQREELRKTVVATPGTAVASSEPSRETGTAASPRLRLQWSEQPAQHPAARFE